MPSIFIFSVFFPKSFNWFAGLEIDSCRRYSIGLLKKYEKEPLKNLLNFMTLCCGILTIETSDCFFRSFCFIGQNGAFSTTEQNGVIFYWLFSKFFWQSDHRFLHSRGAVLWLGQNQNIMLDNFEIFQKVMAFQKMNTKDWHISDCYDITAILQ